MSEYIYNGSFTLGGDQAVQFSAGPGIKIDESVPGKVGIRNDETVLFTTGFNDYVSAGTLSESPWNFEKVRFYQHNLQGGSCITDVSIDVASATTGKNFVIMSPRGNNEINYDAVKVLMTNNGWSATNSKSLVCNWTTTAFSVGSDVANARKSIFKIVGVNRISG